MKVLLQALAVALTDATVRTATPPYYRWNHSYLEGDFFSGWNFWTLPDPTKGAVDYVDYTTASASGLVSATPDRVYVGVDMVKDTGGDMRRSVRIQSKKAYNAGLFIAKFDHVPTGCGTWPAFWMYGEDAEHIWPSWGEYDILEGVHKMSSVMTSLHTTAHCNQSHIRPGTDFAGSWDFGATGKPADSCDIGAPDQLHNQGCMQRGPKATLGEPFNAQGGGTYAAEWDPKSKHIRTWFWPAGLEPAGVASHEPRPETWGTPYSFFSLDHDRCSPTHFHDMHLVFDVTFCGDLGNALWSASCPEFASEMNCQEFVQSHGEEMSEAYWSIRALDVYMPVASVLTTTTPPAAAGAGPRNFTKPHGLVGQVPTEPPPHTGSRTATSTTIYHPLPPGPLVPPFTHIMPTHHNHPPGGGGGVPVPGSQPAPTPPEVGPPTEPPRSPSTRAHAPFAPPIPPLDSTSLTTGTISLAVVTALIAMAVLATTRCRKDQASELTYAGLWRDEPETSPPPLGVSLQGYNGGGHTYPRITGDSYSAASHSTKASTVEVTGPFRGSTHEANKIHAWPRHKPEVKSSGGGDAAARATSPGQGGLTPPRDPAKKVMPGTTSIFPAKPVLSTPREERSKNGDIYHGEWRGGRREGRGVTWYTNGGCCEGEWQAGRMEGPGICWLPHGQTLISRFEHGSPKGIGVFWSADRKEAWRFWDGRLTGEVAIPPNEASAIMVSLGLNPMPPPGPPPKGILSSASPDVPPQEAATLGGGSGAGTNTSGSHLSTPERGDGAAADQRIAVPVPNLGVQLQSCVSRPVNARTLQPPRASRSVEEAGAPNKYY